MGINPMQVSRPVRWQREYVQWSIGHAYVHRTFQSSIESNGQAHVHWTFDLSIGSNEQEYVHWTFGCVVNKLFRMTSYVGINPHAGKQAGEMAKGVCPMVHWIQWIHWTCICPMDISVVQWIQWT